MIPYGRQTIEEDDIQTVVDVLRSDYLTTGPKIAEFEKLVADYVGAKYAVARGAAPVCGCGFGAFSACAYGAQRRPCEKKPGGQKEKVAKQRPRVV